MHTLLPFGWENAPVIELYKKKKALSLRDTNWYLCMKLYDALLSEM